MMSSIGFPPTNLATGFLFALKINILLPMRVSCMGLVWRNGHVSLRWLGSLHTNLSRETRFLLPKKGFPTMNGKLKLKELLPESNVKFRFCYGLKAVNKEGGVFWLCHHGGTGQMWHETCENKVLLSLKKAKKLIKHYTEICQFVTIEAVMIPNHEREFEAIAFGKPLLRPFGQINHQLKFIAKIIMTNEWGEYDLKSSHLWGQVSGLLYSLGYSESEIQDFDIRYAPREGQRSVKQIKWYVEHLLDELLRDGEDPNVAQGWYGRIDGMLFSLGHGRGAAMGLREELVERFCYHAD